MIYVHAKFHICNAHQTERQGGVSHGRKVLFYVLQMYYFSMCIVYSQYILPHRILR
jgi:hypothetical protein